jgi:hypothetical protein
MFRHACRLGLEGIVSKRATSRYKSGRCDAWRKVKNPAYVRRVLSGDRARVLRDGERGRLTTTSAPPGEAGEASQCGAVPISTAAPGSGTGDTLKAFTRADVDADPLGPAKLAWFLMTDNAAIEAKVSKMAPGSLRLKVTPLVRTSDTSAWPVPVVLPANIKNASLRNAPLTL